MYSIEYHKTSLVGLPDAQYFGICRTCGCRGISRPEHRDAWSHSDNLSLNKNSKQLGQLLLT